MKKCSKCGVEKSREEFHKNRSGKDGLQYKCKECACKISRRWAQANPEKAREISRRWAQANPEKAYEKSRRWAQANPEKTREKSRMWARANPEKVHEKYKRWKEANPEYIKERHRATRAQAIATLGGCCSRCGGVEGDPDRWLKLNFHHVDPSTKSFSVAPMFHRGWDYVKDEVAKCVLLCVGCHQYTHRCMNAGVPVKPYTRKKRKVREVA